VKGFFGRLFVTCGEYLKEKGERHEEASFDLFRHAAFARHDRRRPGEMLL
jgi:hypothetical protein